MSRLNTRQVRLGDSATLSQNFIISTPAVPDGTMSIARENGTHVLDVDADGNVTFPGNVQTWQDVSGSRNSGTTYTNTTGQPIMVSVSLTMYASGGSSVSGSVAGVVVARQNMQMINAGPGITFIVPAGAAYSVAISNGGSGYTWMELR